MMEDTWLTIDEDASNDHSFADSDVIDSETEAELYSIIHYGESLLNIKCSTTELKNALTSEVPAQTSDEKNNLSTTEKNSKYVRTDSVCNVGTVSLIGDGNTMKMETFTSKSVFLNELAKKLNPLKVEKSDTNDKVSNPYSEENSLNQTLNDSSLNNKRKRKTDHDSSKSSSLSLVKRNCNGFNDSSDSDSIIWTEIDASVKNKFQTNLYENEDIIYLSSDSESQFNCPPQLNKRKENLKNLSMPNIKLGENVKDLWFINDQDLYRPKKNNSRRYHDNVENTCTNCLRKGHTFRICPMPRTLKCFICGGGGHLGSSCVNRICSKCFRTGHDRRRCWTPCFSHCTLCNMMGHVKENCPDLWRRYHLTTRPGKIVCGKRVKYSKRSYCWNCGENGHFGVVCKESRGHKYCLSTWPCVVNYDDPEDLLRKRSNGSYSKHGSFRREAHLNQRNIANDGGNFTAVKKIKKKKNKLNQHSTNMKALKEKDFPRTPKSNNQSNICDDTIPESLKQLLTKRQKRKEKNRKRRLKQRQALLAQLKTSQHRLQTET